jgi:cysteinyl-tRNA synthetase
LLLNGKKMSKSDGNTVSPEELFTGDSPHLSKGYSPMVIRFFMLQTHYRSTLDLTDEALQAAEKGFRRLMETFKVLKGLQPDPKAQAGELDKEINQLVDLVGEEMSDDFNTPKALARLFELAPKINGLKGGQLSMKDITADTLQRLKQTFNDFIFDIFGLQEESEGGENGLTDGLVQVIIDIRKEARAKKDWAASDQIRDALAELGIVLKDSKEGTTWTRG